MSEIAGTVEVLVRPVTTGFAAAAEPGIAKEGRDIGRDLSKAILAGFAIGGVVEGIKSVVEAATKQNTAFAVLDQTLKNAGQSVVGFSASLHDKLEAQARATGVSAEDLAGAMSRLIPVTGNVGKSVKDLNTAIGISETFHISLSTAALALAKAETGSFTSLQRYLGLIPKVTTAQDALKARYTALIESGGKLDSTQKAQYAAALQVAAAQDKAATAQDALTRAAEKFNGVPQTFAQTYEGQFNRLHVAVDQLKVAVGTELVGGLASGSAGLADWIDKLVASDKVQEEVHNGLATLHGDFATIKSILETVGPPLISVTDHVGGLAKALEGLALAIAAQKLVTALTGVGVAETAVGASAEASATKVDLLKASLTRLGLIGAIAIPIEIILNRKTIQKDVGDFLDKHDLGFLGGTNNLTAKQALTTPLVFDALPDKAKQEVIGKATGAQTAENTITGFVEGFARAFAAKGKATSGITAALDEITKGFKAAQGQLGAKVKEANTAASTAGSTLIQALRDGIASDKTDLAQIKTNLADAITQGAQAVTDAVNQAKQNLNTIGQSLATEIQTILVKPITDAQTALTAAQDKLGIASSRSALTAAQLTLRNLGQSVLLPGGKTLSQDPTKALAQLNALEKKTGSPALRDFITQYQSGIQGEQSAALGVKSASLTVSNDKLTGEANSAATRLTNLTDLVNTGRLTKTAFGSRVGSLLKNLGITPAAAAREFGVSGADTLKGLEQGLLGQAGAITAGPQRVGSGLIPSITRPLQTLHEQNRQINQLRHEEAAKELDEQKKQTKLLTDIANGKAAAKFTSSLDQNPGSASKRTKKLTGVTR